MGDWPVKPSIMQSYARVLGILCTGSRGFLGIIHDWILVHKLEGFPFRSESVSFHALQQPLFKFVHVDGNGSIMVASCLFLFLENIDEV
jgi:hypothetical protein